MKGIVKALNVIVALLIIVIVLLIFWFIFAMFLRGQSAGETVSYMWRTMGGWWSAVSAWIASLFKGVGTV